MPNTIATYTDTQIMHALLTHNFSEIGRSFVDDELTKIKAGAFYKAINLDTVSLPNLEEIRTAAFQDTSITTLELNWSKIRFIGFDVFRVNFDILPENLSLPALTVLGSGAFAGTSAYRNTRLKSISLPIWTGTGSSEPGLSTSTGIFNYCTALTSISAPLLTTLPSYCFQYCSALEAVSFPKVASYSSNVFTGCTSLKKIDLGGDITSMSLSFLPAGASTRLEALILRGVTSVPTLGSSVFTSTQIALGNAYVYVPRSLLSTFQVASNWSTYSAQLRAIEDYPAVTSVS